MRLMRTLLLCCLAAATILVAFRYTRAQHGDEAGSATSDSTPGKSSAARLPRFDPFNSYGFRLANEFYEIESGLLRESDGARHKDAGEAILLKRVCTFSGRLQLEDRHEKLSRALEKDQLHDAVALVAPMQVDLTQLYRLLEDDPWTKRSDIERTVLRRYLELLDAAKLRSGRLAREFGRYQRSKDRKMHILLFAGGPTREYQFLRDELGRDSELIVDVLLQTATLGSEQDCHALLGHFPLSIDELAKYDVVIAIDTDWSAIDSSNEDGQSVSMLKNWVYQACGGLILIAGPVYTRQTLIDSRLSAIRQMLPLQTRIKPPEAASKSVDESDLFPLIVAYFGSESPSAIDFTGDQTCQELFRLGDSAAENRTVWAAFGGIYDCFPLRREKPGATVFARLRDPDATLACPAPIFAATQPYGGGQVLYLGSGQLWRLRALDESYFAQIYKRLINFVTRGRRGEEQNGNRPPVQMVFRSTLDISETYYSALKPILLGVLSVVDGVIIEQARAATFRWADLDRFFTITERLRKLIEAHRNLGGEIKKRQKQELLLDQN